MADHSGEAPAAAAGSGPFRGCLFCKAGREQRVVQLFPEGAALFPTKVRYRRMGGQAIEEQTPLLPGYVFFETADPDFDLRQLKWPNDILKLLSYGDGAWQLHGYDAQFAEMLFREKGRIGLSLACFDEGDRIRIVDGFLKAYEGAIIRVNRRAKTAQVSIPFQEKNITMWLGFELIERGENGNR